MKKLKIKLLCKCLIYIFLFGYIIYSYYTREDKSKYHSYDNDILGTIRSISVDGNCLTLEVLAKEKVFVVYYFKTKKEKENITSSLQLGDVYRFVGTFTKAKGATNKNLFSYHDYLLSKKIYWILNAESIEFIRATASPLYTIKNYVYDRVEHMKNRSYFYTFIVGDSRQLEPAIKEKWQRCGVSHLIAVSGMHLGLLVTCLNWLLRKFPKKIRAFILLCVLGTYSFIVGFTASVVRSFLLTIVPFFLKKIQSKQKLLLQIAVLFLCYNPYYIYSIGFLFSFIITFFVLSVGPILQKNTSYIIRLFSISWISFVASIPIVSISFFEVNLLSLVANLVMVPFVSFIVFPIAVLTFCFPVIEPMFGWIIWLTEQIISFLDMYRWMHSIPRMPVLLICCYYSILFWLIKKEWYKKTILLFLFVYIFSYYRLFVPYARVVMLDVGQGDCILIQLPYGRGNVLMDTGGILSYPKEEWKKKREEYSIAKRVVLPYLKSEGIHRLDALIITHGDADHAKEAIPLLQSFPVSQVIMNRGNDTNLEQEIQKISLDKHIPFQTISTKSLVIGGQRFYFLNNTDAKDENEDSLIVYTKLNQKNILFMGDSGAESENYILHEYFLPKMDILKVGHHGSKYSSSEKFVQTIQPRISLISVGQNNRYGHPSKDIVSGLQEVGSSVFLTSVHGMIEVILKSKMTVNTWN